MGTFEEGLRASRENLAVAEGERLLSERQKAEDRATVQKSNQRLLALIAPKVGRLGFWIGIEDGVLKIDPRERSPGGKAVFHASEPDACLYPDPKNPKVTRLYFRKLPRGSTVAGDEKTNSLDDAGVLYHVGRYCELIGSFRVG